MPAGTEFEALLAELIQRPAGALVRQLPRQPGQKEARWTQLLTGEPLAGATPADMAEPLKVTLALPPEVEQRLAALEKEVVHLRAELVRLRGELGGS
jgi:uncharacterized protein YceH (UPF0502 family)